ncbi:bifunctional 2-polyprenyl-6-hydroxyphenol methylase/3-demethylubiquinol 3-O-methyltransferase UbiG [Acidocella sp.]|uniref:class I SAM-dependent methyltransferase n=1 Tax=Acidocella sp. TaxID=50710 RepID=UPI00185B82F4|nr:class I SAM-dependent methyltransferase [Acidocella sp.]NNM56346.1 class I SAM-dependent methyltransferase [Acidocella sp.]
MEAEAYLDMAAVEARHWWFAGRRRILGALIGSLKLPANARILELGSGTGGNFALLAQFGSVTAVEMNETAREISKTRGGEAAVHHGMLPEDLPLEGHEFDLVCLFDVLEHVEADEAALRAIRGLLAPGGRALITVPAHPSLFGPHDIALHHIRRYTRAQFAARLRAAGLRVQKLSFMNMALAPLAFAARWLDRLRGTRQASGTSIPPGPVNALFTGLFGAEAHLLPRINLPFGLSLVAVVSATD